MSDIQIKTCPTCKEEQMYDVIYGYSNQYCPDFCRLIPLPNDCYEENIG